MGELRDQQHRVPLPSASNIPYANNSVNEIATFNGIALGYDSRGNYLGQLAFPVYSFDAENRMVKAVNYTYAYDPLGRRTQKVIGAVTTNFVHDGDMEIAEYDGTGALLRRFVPGPVIDDHVAMVTAAGVKTFFHTDKMGSVIDQRELCVRACRSLEFLRPIPI